MNKLTIRVRFHELSSEEQVTRSTHYEQGQASDIVELKRLLKYTIDVDWKRVWEILNNWM